MVVPTPGARAASPGGVDRPSLVPAKAVRVVSMDQRRYLRRGSMAEFFEVPIRREDGSEGVHFVNIEAISYIDLNMDNNSKQLTNLAIYLNNGYWFTLSGAKMEEVLSLVKARASVWIKGNAGDN
jgi:hypothetical protein